jgi:hypothetical protein
MGVWMYSSTILNSDSRWRSVVSFTPWETVPDTHFVRGWVGLGVFLDFKVKREISCYYQELNSDSSVVHTVA